MPEENEGDAGDGVIWGVDLKGARLRDVDLTGARLQNVWLIDVEAEALVDRFVINGVDVTDYVNERDPWHRSRSAQRAATPEEMREGWAAIEAEWAKAVERARALPGDALHQQVDGEWSFVQTLRHLVFAVDKWFTAPVLGEAFHPMGMPNSGSVDFPWPGLDPALSPSFAEALAVHEDRAARVRDYLASVDPGDLEREVEVLENGANPVRHCVQVVFEEEFWHLRYAVRDMARLEADA